MRLPDLRESRSGPDRGVSKTTGRRAKDIATLASQFKDAKADLYQQHFLAAKQRCLIEFFNGHETCIRFLQ